MTRKIDVPMWGIFGDDSLSELASVIVQLRIEIKKTEQEAIEKEKEIETFNNRLNMYVRTIIENEDYDNSNDLLVINEKNEASIYKNALIEEKFDFNNLPCATSVHKINHKQAFKIKNYLDEFNNLAFDYEDVLDDYDELVESHEEVWKKTHESLSDTYCLQLLKSNQNEDVEMFNKKKHVLFVVKEDDGSWGFKYIRKKDEKRFYKYIDEKQSGEEI